MGAERFHGRVRDGFVCVTLAIPTKSHRTDVVLLQCVCFFREITTPHTICFVLNRIEFFIFITIYLGVEFVTIKPMERLVPVSYRGYPPSTSGLST